MEKSEPQKEKNAIGPGSGNRSPKSGRPGVFRRFDEFSSTGHFHKLSASTTSNAGQLDDRVSERVRESVQGCYFLVPNSIWDAHVFDEPFPVILIAYRTKTRMRDPLQVIRIPAVRPFPDRSCMRLPPHTSGSNV